MEGKSEYSDILLEKETDNKASKFKKFILLVGVLVLVFLVVLISMKAINKTPQDDEEAIAKEMGLKPSKRITKPEDDPLFKQVPIIQEDSKNEGFEEMVRKLKEKEKKRIKEEKVKPKEEKPIKIIKAIPEEEKIIILPKKVDTPKPVKPKKVKVKKKPVKKAKAKTRKKVHKNYNTYIQVLASSKLNSDASYIRMIKSKGYSYRLYKTRVKGTMYLKVLVGPYRSRAEANHALPKVKRDLNPNAFIFKTK